jgi:hypothetical protein
MSIRTESEASILPVDVAANFPKNFTVKYRCANQETTRRKLRKMPKTQGFPG